MVTVSLGSVADVIMGQSPTGTSYNRKRQGVPLINGPTEFTNRNPVKVQWTTRPTKMCKKGDLLLCVRGSSTGRYNISNEKYCIGRGIAAIRAKEGGDTMYLVYQIDAAIQKLLRMSAGSTFPNLDGKAIRALPIWVPSYTEQKKIAEALSDVDELIIQSEKLISKKQNIKTAAMQQLLTGKKRLQGFKNKWKPTLLDQVGIFFRGRNTPKSCLKSEGLDCVVYGEIYTRYNATISKFHSKIGVEQAPHATLIKDGDIIFAGSGETLEDIGKCSAYIGKQEAYAGGDIVILRPSNADSRYLGYILNTKSVIRQKMKMAQGSSVIHIYSRDLKKIELILPDKKEQKAIADILSDMDAEIVELEKQLKKTKAIKQGMMQELLTGKTRLISDNDKQGAVS